MLICCIVKFDTLLLLNHNTLEQYIVVISLYQENVLF